MRTSQVDAIVEAVLAGAVDVRWSIQRCRSAA
jgi:hypothetical protein